MHRRIFVQNRAAAEGEILVGHSQFANDRGRFAFGTGRGGDATEQDNTDDVQDFHGEKTVLSSNHSFYCLCQWLWITRGFLYLFFISILLRCAYENYIYDT